MASTRKGAPDPAGRVAACLARHLPRGGRLWVGYSGGLDSSVLLYLLAGLRQAHGYSLNAIHVHHGLSPHADDWARHCEQVCRRLDVPLRVEPVRVVADGAGPEAAARAVRYAVFSRLPADALALAHHRDDQAETVLGQLLRGAGAKGLAAMPEARALADGHILLLRPLLATSRSDLEEWARSRGLEWVEDESNRSTHLTRNALRHDILPLIESHLPGAGANLARAAGRFAETARLLDDLADLDAQGAVGDAGLEIAHLATLPEPRARNLLRRYLERAGAELHPERLREGLRQLLEARDETQMALRFGPVELRRHRGRALAVPVAREPVAGLDAPQLWRGEPRLDLGESGLLEFQRVERGGLGLDGSEVTLRRRRGGENFRPDAKRPRRPLKDWLREAGIPPWQRERLPLLFVGERLAWVAGLGMDIDCRAKPGEPGWQLAWRPTSPDRTW